ncbi:hypothetical protein HYX18_04680 [Candidatus Woesearchaeota archaeon]|nr:hypothetical protein [Candidatus Woesearchaeota archaeon]
MEKEVSNKVVVILVVVAVLVSLISTYLVTLYVGKVGTINTVQIQEKNIEKNIITPPQSAGYVGINIIPK